VKLDVELGEHVDEVDLFKTIKIRGICILAKREYRQNM
jgi:hypothetical protein